MNPSFSENDRYNTSPVVSQSAHQDLCVPRKIFVTATAKNCTPTEADSRSTSILTKLAVPHRKELPPWQSEEDRRSSCSFGIPDYEEKIREEIEAIRNARWSTVETSLVHRLSINNRDQPQRLSISSMNKSLKSSIDSAGKCHGMSQRK
mmetsp:Transcript_9019/g.12475  ORF Transcript_9019/g.12475 Transcript_9019/m.12475 type:complete len:149 (-) Transcript_9019:270-716(-)